MSENPITNLSNYRLVVLKYLPRLEKLDDIAVTYHELEQAREVDVQQMIEDGELGLTDNSNVTPVKSAKKSFVQTTFVPNESQQYVPPSGNKVSSIHYLI